MFGFFKKKKAPEQVSDMSCVLAIADCISRSNPAVHADLEQCLNEPQPMRHGLRSVSRNAA